MQPYPKNNTKENAGDNLNVIARLRDQDIIDRNNFLSIFVSGRTVGKIPSSSADIAATDRIGDVSTDGNFNYYFVNISGIPEWRRIALGSW